MSKHIVSRFGTENGELVNLVEDYLLAKLLCSCIKWYILIERVLALCNKGHSKHLEISSFFAYYKLSGQIPKL